MNQNYENNYSTITIADLAEAIAEGRLTAQRDEEYYTVTVRDLIQITRQQIAAMPPIQPQYQYVEQRELALAS